MLHQNLLRILSLFMVASAAIGAKVVFAVDCSQFTIGQCDRSVLQAWGENSDRKIKQEKNICF
jgi:hypothetical protein